jgi:hypothetical protein
MSLVIKDINFSRNLHLFYDSVSILGSFGILGFLGGLPLTPVVCGFLNIEVYLRLLRANLRLLE